MELTNYSRVAIVGGGPAGSLTAYFMLDLAEQIGISLNLDIYEPAQFGAPGAKGCNYCGGIASETLVQMLAMEGINLPPEVVQRGIDSYRLHTEQGSATINTPLEEMRIAALYRGSGPLDNVTWSELLPEKERVTYRSFDGFLLDLAIKKGANHKPNRVKIVNLKDQFPMVEAKGTDPRRYDLVVGAVGVNGGGLKVFEKSGLNFKPPAVTKAFVTEIRLGREGVDRTFGNAMHVFLLKIPRVSFAAIIPKGEYVTVIMLGKDLDHSSAAAFLTHPKVIEIFPEGTDLSPKSCKCKPDVNIGMASSLFSDRVVLVGDAAVSRLYKDGLGAAYKTAKACAFTALVHGVSTRDFRKYYYPVCRKLDLDNTIGKMVFLTVDLFKWFPPLSRGMLGMVRREQDSQVKSLDMSMVLWDTFTGSNSYLSIVFRCIHPAFQLRLFLECFRSLFRRGDSAGGGRLAERPGGGANQ